MRHPPCPRRERRSAREPRAAPAVPSPGPRSIAGRMPSPRNRSAAAVSWPFFWGGRWKAGQVHREVVRAGRVPLEPVDVLRPSGERRPTLGSRRCRARSPRAGSPSPASRERAASRTAPRTAVRKGPGIALMRTPWPAVAGAEPLYVLGHLADQVGEPAALGCGHPGELHAVRLDADVGEQVLDRVELTPCHEIAAEVVAISWHGVSSTRSRTCSPTSASSRTTCTSPGCPHPRRQVHRPSPGVRGREAARPQRRLAKESA